MMLMTVWMNFWIVFASIFALSSANTCSSNGEYLVISEGLVQKVIPSGDGSQRIQSYPFDYEFHPLCNVNGTCKALLARHNDKQKHIWIPSAGHAQYYQLNEGSNIIAMSSELHGENCFDFFSISARVIGALCLRTTPDEHLVVPFKINVSTAGVHDNQLGIELHINVDDHSPFINLYDDRGGPVVLYVTFAEHLSSYKLVVIRYHSEDYVIVDIPSGCMHPHDLQPVGEYDALIRCDNGVLLYYNGENLALTQLAHRNIEIISSCVNSSSFIMVQDISSILFNDSTSGIVYSISVDTSGLDTPSFTVTSAVCYAHGNDISFYFTSRESNYVYQIHLGDIARGRSVAPQIIKLGDAQNSEPVSLKIDGYILWGTQKRSDTDIRVYLVNLLTQEHSRASVSGSTVFVLQYRVPQCNDSETPLITVNPPNNAERHSTNHSTNILWYILIPAGVLVVLAVVSFSALYFIIRCQRHKKKSNSNMESGVEMSPISPHVEISGDNDSNDNSSAVLLPEEVLPAMPSPTAVVQDDKSELVVDTKMAHISKEQAKNEKEKRAAADEMEERDTELTDLPD